MTISRRQFTTGAVGLSAALGLPPIAHAAANTPKRFVFVIQRGAADGLAIVAPTGDPSYASLRGPLLKDLDKGAKLNSFFTLHPAMRKTAALYGQGEAMFSHALASTYRERSHFDGQNILESGGGKPYARKDGWINRFLKLLPANERQGLALASSIPLAMRGKTPVTSFAPTRLPDANQDLIERVTGLYAGDPLLDPVWQNALKTQMLVSDIPSRNAARGANVGLLAANLLKPADGARVMMIETGGWDTHSQQINRLNNHLTALDALIFTLRRELGPVWKDTLVLVATEFGRTARVNGTRGTDHGTASAAMLLGGSLNKAGRVLTDWPGLRAADLYQGRDLQPTSSLEGFIIDALSAHYRMDNGKLRRTLFPDFV